MKCICESDLPPRIVKISMSSVYSRENGKKYQLLECAKCKVLQTSPLPSVSELSDLYSDNYAYSFHNAVAVEKSFRARALIRLVQESTPSRKLLEFGSGSGILLNEAANLGFDVFGVELSELAINSLPATLREMLVRNSAENFLLNCERLPSIVVMSHTVEHFLNPDEILMAIHKKQGIDGILVLAVPNNKNFLNRYRSRFWGYWQVPVHTYHFNHDSLNQLLERVGFKVIKVAYRSGDFLSKGLFVSNLFNLSGGSIPKKNMITLLKFLSRFWHLFYRFGRSDLIVIAKKI